MKRRTNHFIAMTVVATSLMTASLMADAAILRITEAAFTAQAGKITFSEFPLGTVNPIYTPAKYGGAATAPTVTFDGFFGGQALGTMAPPCPLGAILSGCVLGSPTGPLALLPSSPDTMIVSDGANPTSPVLSGSPVFNGPISILFSVDIAGVGLDGGFFDAIASTAISAFDRTGALLGQVKNVGLGIEFLGLVTDDGSAKIAGLQFSLVGAEPAGFAIDNLRFGQAGEVTVPGVPEPGTLALLGLGMLAALGMRRRAK